MNEQTEDRWDVQLEDAPAKRGVPVWVWGCGGGCLFLLVAAIGGTWWFVDKMMGMFGPEAAWPVIAEVMPYGPEGTTGDVVEARPAGYQPFLIPISQLAETFGDAETLEGSGGPTLSDIVFISPGEDPSQPRGTGLSVMVFVFDGLVEGDVMDQIASDLDWKQSEVEGESDGLQEVDFQGRVTDAMHMRVDPEQTNQMLPGGGDPQGIFMVDVTGERSRSVVVAGLATGEMDATLEDLEAFLAPFRVWDGK